MREVDPVEALALLPFDDSGHAGRHWLQDTLAWLKSAAPGERTVRLRSLAEGISRHPRAGERFQRIWEEAFAPRLYAEAGLAEGTSLARELVLRLKRRLLPQVEDDLDLYAALETAELDDRDAEWIATLADQDIGAWRELLGGSRGDFPVAIRLLAVRSAAIGLSRGIMKVMPHRRETESPFFALADAAGGLGDAVAPEAASRIGQTVIECRISAGLSHARLEELGVSSDLVFRLDLLLGQLERIEALLRAATGQEDVRRFAAMLVRACAESRGVHSLLRNSVNRVARQIVAHTGKSGEHYIAGSLTEWRRMGYGALGAGGITAFTALFKYILAGMALAPMWIGIAHSLNYTVSFVLMQFLGWRLASKMPSMTAAALCDALDKEDGMQSEVELVAAIARTQTIVTAGNLLGAVPLALLIDLLVQWRNGSPFLSQEVARHGLESMHLLRSWTVFYAALTGCFLWLSSLVAGWTANWLVLNRLPEAIAQSRRVRAALGSGGALEAGRLVEHHFSGVAGYVCLGLLLGLLPFVSVFAGFPVEVRHITLASASLAYDVGSLIASGPLPPADLFWADLLWAALGLLATGLLNFSVSFALGMWLALRARYVGTRGRRELIAALWTEFRRHPSRFLWRHEFGTTPVS
jgi:site-specific recombinase